MSENLKIDRRRFLGTAAITIAAAELGIIGGADAKPGKINLAAIAGRAANTSFGAIKQVNAGLLNVGYAEAGPANGPAVILLHGWPYDIHSFVDVAPLLAAKGYRVIVPHLRGYGTTHFISAKTFRNGQPSALALDIIALMDVLKIQKAVLAGFDWGARTADIIAALWPQRCRALVSVSGYLIGSQEAGKLPLPPSAELQWWYQFYFATDRGKAGYDKYRHDFAKLIWQLASPKWNFDDATFDRSAAAFDNPDHVAIVIHKTAGDRALYTASLNTTTWRCGWPKARLSLVPTIHTLLATPPCNRTCHQAPTQAGFPANMRTGLSMEAWGTTCPRKASGRPLQMLLLK